MLVEANFEYAAKDINGRNYTKTHTILYETDDKDTARSDFKRWWDRQGCHIWQNQREVWLRRTYGSR